MDGLAKILEAQTKDKEPQVITGDWTNNISVSDMFSKDEVQKYYDIIKDIRITILINSFFILFFSFLKFSKLKKNINIKIWEDLSVPCSCSL